MRPPEAGELKPMTESEIERHNLSPFVTRDGTVKCRQCRARLGSLWFDDAEDGGGWWAEDTNGEAAGFGPEEVKKDAALLLLPGHECAS